MTEGENRDNIESVYDKLTEGVPQELFQDRFYQYFYNLLETGTNYFSYYRTRLIKTIDEEWVGAIEEALPDLQYVTLHPRKFIEEDRQIVNVAMARNITSESIQHLLSHANLIDKVNEDGTVIPNRVLNVYKEESYNIYENRFIATLIRELQRFINRRFEVIFDSSRDEVGTFFEMESRLDNYTETVDYKLRVKVREKQTDKDNVSENTGIFTRISRIHQQINDLAQGAFMTQMHAYPPVRHPIVKTNAIGKNLHYKACHKLWNYIHSYERIGYKVDMVKQEPMQTKELQRDIYHSFLWDYAMLKHYTGQNDAYCEDRPKRKKEIDVKYIRQALDEIIRGVDMPDASLRKLIMNELTDLQLKRRMEKSSVEAAKRARAGKKKEDAPQHKGRGRRRGER